MSKDTLRVPEVIAGGFRRRCEDTKIVTVHDCYIRTKRDTPGLLGVLIEPDADGAFRHYRFDNCTFSCHSDGTFEDCAINGKRIPDGAGNLREYYLRIVRVPSGYRP